MQVWYGSCLLHSREVQTCRCLCLKGVFPQPQQLCGLHTTGPGQQSRLSVVEYITLVEGLLTHGQHVWVSPVVHVEGLLIVQGCLSLIALSNDPYRIASGLCAGYGVVLQCVCVCVYVHVLVVVDKTTGSVRSLPLTTHVTCVLSENHTSSHVIRPALLSTGLCLCSVPGPVPSESARALSPNTGSCHLC